MQQQIQVSVEVTYDRSADALYIYFEPRQRGSATTFGYLYDPETDAAFTIILDARRDAGTLAGLEVLCASVHAPGSWREALGMPRRPTPRTAEERQRCRIPETRGTELVPTAKDDVVFRQASIPVWIEREWDGDIIRIRFVRETGGATERLGVFARMDERPFDGSLHTDADEGTFAHLEFAGANRYIPPTWKRALAEA